MAKKIVPTAPPALANLDDPKILGQFIRAKRTSLALRLEDCAALCDVGINTLSRIENGNNNCTLGAMFKVINGLGLSLSFSNFTDSSGNLADNQWV